MDHLLVCLAVAVGQWRKWVAHLHQVRDQTMVLSKNEQKLTISRTHLSLYFAATAAVLPGPAAAPCIVPALACDEMCLRTDLKLINYLHWCIEISGVGMWLILQSWDQHLKVGKS